MEEGRGPRRRRKVSPSKLKASLESRRKPRESKGGRARGTERGKACCTRVREKGILYLQLCSLSGHIFPGTALQQSRSFPRNRVSSHRPSSLSALLGLISARSAPFPPVAPATLLSPRILLQWCGSVAVTAVVVFSYARTRNRRLQKNGGRAKRRFSPIDTPPLPAPPTPSSRPSASLGRGREGGTWRLPPLPPHCEGAAVVLSCRDSPSPVLRVACGDGETTVINQGFSFPSPPSPSQVGKYQIFF